MAKEMMIKKKVIVIDMLRPLVLPSAFPTLQGAAQQGVQLRVDLCLLLQHVEQQLVLGGAVDLGLLQPALHHLQLGLLLRRLQTLTEHSGPVITGDAAVNPLLIVCVSPKQADLMTPPCLYLQQPCVAVITSTSSFVLCCCVERISSLDQLGFIKSNLI